MTTLHLKYLKTENFERRATELDEEQQDLLYRVCVLSKVAARKMVAAIRAEGGEVLTDLDVLIALSLDEPAPAGPPPVPAWSKTLRGRALRITRVETDTKE